MSSSPDTGRLPDDLHSLEREAAVFLQRTEQRAKQAGKFGCGTTLALAALIATAGGLGSTAGWFLLVVGFFVLFGLFTRGALKNSVADFRRTFQRPGGDPVRRDAALRYLWMRAFPDSKRIAVSRAAKDLLKELGITHPPRGLAQMLEDTAMVAPSSPAPATPAASSGGAQRSVAPAPPPMPAASPARNTSGESVRTTSGEPARTLSGDPTRATSGDPTRATSGDPTRATSGDPTRAMSGDPTRATSGDPTRATSGDPTRATTGEPARQPTRVPQAGRPEVADTGPRHWPTRVPPAPPVHTAHAASPSSAPAPASKPPAHPPVTPPPHAPATPSVPVPHAPTASGSSAPPSTAYPAPARDAGSVSAASTVTCDYCGATRTIARGESAGLCPSCFPQIELGA